MGKRKIRRYTVEQKRQAVELAEKLGNVAQAARDLGLAKSVLYRWVDEAEGRGGPPVQEEGPLSADEREELKRLRKEVNVLQMARDFLKKAAAFFAEDPKKRSS